jgi:Fe-S cluster assembly protein SufD
VLVSLEQLGGNRVPASGRGLVWLEGVRAAGRRRFVETGLPSRRIESWKYTDLQPIGQVAFRSVDDPVSATRVEPAALPSSAVAPACRLVFVDGRCRPDLSTNGNLPVGVRVDTLASLLAADGDAVAGVLGRVSPADGAPLPALNAALLEDGFVLRIASGCELTAPVEILFLGGGGGEPVAYHPRNLILAEPGSRAVVIERHLGIGNDAYLANSVTEISVGEGARLCHGKVQDEGGGAFHIASVAAKVSARAGYEFFCLSTGARLSRNEIAVDLAGSDADCIVAGAYLMRDHQHCDMTTVVEHREPRTRCREVFKGVVDDSARAVFQGRIVVHRDAQQADGHQLSKALLLSDTAAVDQKPELAISADDVKCSHGAAAGQLDPQQLFYLRARGVPEPRARRLLIEGFLAEAFEQVADDRIRDDFARTAFAWFDRERRHGC